MAQHAILSASGAKKWLTCPPSARLELQFENKTSEAAEEGTLAHELGELTLRKELKFISTRKFNSEFKKIEAHELFTKDMPDYVDIYVNTCMEKVSEARAKTPDAVINLEQRLDYSEWVPEGFGTGDMVVIADGTIEIIDLKYGKGVPVSAIGNTQMRLYALGAISEFSFLYDIKNVKMTIIQPRLDSISTDEISAIDLLYWASEKLAPAAALAFKGEGDFCAGEHCSSGFCRANAVCKARADKNMELAIYEFQDSSTLSIDEIADIIGKCNELAKWAKDVQEYALEQAVSGIAYPGWKLVEGRSNRRYTDVDAISDILMDEFTQDKVYKPAEILGISAMEKSIGKKRFGELVGDYIEKPVGKPVLVVETDKREVFNKATADFEMVPNG
ncbi:DUF2800 domain-containing protein [Clostridium estertheticum]|uniref:DUF2800 domain-containing protein n=1 Tax=Clostridium estertheticum TaxID=238834 RepID=A0AA47I743_9CLOT|nr:DUF2800 domain-containing protein [Clostridium estertheticum]MBU3155154.1 DUF2800 domain-containing protein [Clostridium estertheticum]WAG61208.1 DUF2800 domain-containing protein [Clostridium estertheticum]